MASIIAWFGDNAKQVNAAERQATLQEEAPELLQKDEKVVMAFHDRGGKGRDNTYFTTSRIIIRDKIGLTGKKIKYKSIV